eukprot:CAMPEP_0183592032 /NCGR_PEP_ID=MMETSP0371-20130417/167306_1 /TAXON_ID=268820 /ORGANISM="Peridinium aciculiferum, Strain PAER-2" /LENGTH=308 /DNA_ID=CAMNT_0025803529 /DNA_START=15 /DNA_END=944 /DNA_ORIENTATION=+
MKRFGFSFCEFNQVPFDEVSCNNNIEDASAPTWTEKVAWFFEMCVTLRTKSQDVARPTVNELTFALMCTTSGASGGSADIFSSVNSTRPCGGGRPSARAHGAPTTARPPRSLPCAVCLFAARRAAAHHNADGYSYNRFSSAAAAFLRGRRRPNCDPDARRAGALVATLEVAHHSTTTAETDARILEGSSGWPQGADWAGRRQQSITLYAVAVCAERTNAVNLGVLLCEHAILAQLTHALHQIRGGVPALARVKGEELPLLSGGNLRKALHARASMPWKRKKPSARSCRPSSAAGAGASGVEISASTPA